MTFANVRRTPALRVRSGVKARVHQLVIMCALVALSASPHPAAATVVGVGGAVKILDGTTGAPITFPGISPTSPDNVIDGTTYTDTVSSATTGRSVATQGFASTSFYIYSNPAGSTITFEVSNDNTNWVTGEYFRNDGTVSTSGTTTAAGRGFIINTAGYAFARWRVSTYTSGSIVVTTAQKRYASIPWYATTYNGYNFDGSDTLAVSTRLNCQDSAPQVGTTGYFINTRGDCRTSATLTRPFESYAKSWIYTPASGGIVNTTTAVTIKAAVASYRACVTDLHVSHDALSSVTELAIRDGAGGSAIWRDKLQTSAVEAGSDVHFQTPVCGSVGNLLEIVTLTAVTGGVYTNVSGFVQQ